MCSFHESFHGVCSSVARSVTRGEHPHLGSQRLSEVRPSRLLAPRRGPVLVRRHDLWARSAQGAPGDLIHEYAQVA
jgi:hypothetical protein